MCKDSIFWINYCDFCAIFILIMNKAYQELSASALRFLLIEEIENFIRGLEQKSVKELQANKLKIKEVLNFLRDKESKEMTLLLWGKNSTEDAKIIPLIEELEDQAKDEGSESSEAKLA